MSKVCVFHTLNIGDTVVLTPSIEYLKTKYTDVYIVCSENAYKVLKGIVQESRIFIYNNNLWDYVKLIIKLRKFGFDKIFDFHNSYFGIKKFIFSFLISKKKTERHGFKTKQYKGFLLTQQVDWISGQKHEVDTYFDLVSFHKNVDKKFYVYQDRKGEKIFNRDYIVIHAGSLNKRKLWSSEKFALLAEQLRDKFSIDIVFTGLAQEKYIIDEIFTYIKKKDKIHNVCGKYIFHEFVNLIAGARLLVSIDTSAIHIATATKTKTVAIFGPTNINAWQPYDKSFQKLAHYKMDCYPCEIEFQAKPCDKHIECLKKIEVSDVFCEVENSFI